MVAQQMKVTGVVINEDDGEPVIGASIVVKGTTIGTITDLDGKFELETQKDAKLIISGRLSIKAAPTVDAEPVKELFFAVP